MVMLCETLEHTVDFSRVGKEHACASVISSRRFHLWAVGWSEVPLQLLQTDLLLLELLGDRLQLLWVQLGIQGTHLTCKNTG